MLNHTKVIILLNYEIYYIISVVVQNGKQKFESFISVVSSSPSFNRSKTYLPLNKLVDARTNTVRF